MNHAEQAFEGQRVPQRLDTISVIECGSEGLIHDEGKRQVVSVNATARFILDRCDGKKSRNALVDELMEAYPGTDRAILEADLAETLRMFVEAGLVE